jgi:hypothetical protein
MHVPQEYVIDLQMSHVTAHHILYVLCLVYYVDNPILWNTSYILANAFILRHDLKLFKGIVIGCKYQCTPYVDYRGNIDTMVYILQLRHIRVLVVSDKFCIALKRVS